MIHRERQLPRCVAKRMVPLPGNRRFEAVVLEDPSGRLDCWFRLLSSGGFAVAVFLIPPDRLRDLARALNDLAGELGTAP